MKVELFVSRTSAPCQDCERVWQDVARNHDFEFSVVDLDELEGQRQANRLNIKTIPAVVINGVLVAIGVQSLDEAHELISHTTEKSRT